MIGSRRALAVGLLAGALVLGACGGGSDTASDPLGRAAEVMNLDAALLTYQVAPNDRGGSVTVEVNSDFEFEEIGKLHKYLREQQARFREGDFGAERRIHGDDTPGLDALERGHDRLMVSYVDLPTGGTLTFRSDDPELVAAVHEWLNRVVIDFADRIGSTTTRPEGTPDVPPGLLG